MKDDRRIALNVTLWVLAVVLMLSAAIYQRRTGPTRPMKGSFEAAGQSHGYRLLRSEITTTDARIVLPAAEGCGTARLWYKRYATGDRFSPLQLHKEEDELAAYLPAQPAAGKLEYYLIVDCADGEVRIPAEDDGNVIIRFRGDVPIYVLLPHVVLMFFSVLIGIRAGLAALFRPRGLSTLTWVTLAGMSVGGMILGPVVQKYAFGALWTGFPFGYDLTDNKMLIMWLVWLAACAVVGFKPKGSEKASRVAVVLATLVMIAVYLIPHSRHGSQLDYDRLDEGVPASDAIGTG